MTWVKKAACDRPGCGHTSNGSTAGWWAVGCADGVVQVTPLGEYTNLEHACGKECALVLVSKHMDAITKEEYNGPEGPQPAA